MKNDLPALSTLYAERFKYKYSDTFVISLQRNDVQPSELIAAFFNSAPPWVDKLFVLRNRLAGYLGLKTGSSTPRTLCPPYHVGQRIGLFRLLEMTDTEVVIGENDRHLDFRTSLLLVKSNTEPQLAVSTLVNTKNLLGVVYFFVVKPFHRFIASSMTRAMARRIDTKTDKTERARRE